MAALPAGTPVPLLLLAVLCVGAPSASKPAGVSAPVRDERLQSRVGEPSERRWSGLRFRSGPVRSEVNPGAWSTSLIIEADGVLIQLEDGVRLNIPSAGVTALGYLREAFRDAVMIPGSGIIPFGFGRGVFGKSGEHLISIEFKDSTGKVGGVLVEAPKDVYLDILRRLTDVTGVPLTVGAADRERVPRDLPIRVVAQPLSGALPDVPQRPVRWLSGHLQAVTSLAFSPDGSMLAAGGADGTIRFWKTGSGLPYGLTISTPLRPVRGLAFSADGRTLASWSYDGRDGIHTWDVARRDRVGQVSVGLKRIDTLVLTRDLEFAAAVGEESSLGDTVVTLIDVNGRRPTPKPLLRVPRSSGIGVGVGFDPDGPLLLAWYSRALHVWEADSGDLVRQIESPVRLSRAALVKGTNHLIASDPDGSLFLIRVTDGHVVASERVARPRRLEPDGSAGGIVASVDSFRTVLLSDGTTLERVGMPLVGQRGTISDLAFDSAGKLLATVSAGQVVIWDVGTQMAVWQCLTGPPEHFGYWGSDNNLPRVWFAPDGATIATTGTGDSVIALCSDRDVPEGRADQAR